MDAAGRLSFPSLLHWAPSQSSLVVVVAEALSELSGLQHAGAQSAQPSSSGTFFGIRSDVSTTCHIHRYSTEQQSSTSALEGLPSVSMCPSALLQVLLQSAARLESDVANTSA